MLELLGQAAGFPAEQPVLAEGDFYPKESPPGYEFLDDEPSFDPAVHLQLEQPEKIWTMADLGYSERVISRFPSRIALTSPARILSKEGAATLEAISKRLQPYIRHRPNSPRVAAALRGTTFRSRFIRDLCLSADVTDFFSQMFGTPLMPHTVTHHQGHMNYAPLNLEQQVDSWHHDSTALDYVLMVHNPRELKGGRFEVFLGTREEGAALLKAHGDVPRDRVYTPDFPDAGYACYMQGAAVYHRASRLEERGFRASVVQSYVSRDVRFPDTNRFYYSAMDESADPNSMLERNVSLVEWAKHRAWMSRAKLGWIIENMPFTESTESAIAQLEAAVVDVNDFIETVKAGRMSMAEAMARRAALDAAQTA